MKKEEYSLITKLKGIMFLSGLFMVVVFSATYFIISTSVYYDDIGIKHHIELSFRQWIGICLSEFLTIYLVILLLEFLYNIRKVEIK